MTRKTFLNETIFPFLFFSYLLVLLEIRARCILKQQKNYNLYPPPVTDPPGCHLLSSPIRNLISHSSYTSEDALDFTRLFGLSPFGSLDLDVFC